MTGPDPREATNEMLGPGTYEAMNQVPGSRRLRGFLPCEECGALTPADEQAGPSRAIPGRGVMTTCKSCADR